MSKFTQYLKRTNKAALATLGLLSLSFTSQAQYCIPMSFSDCSDGDQINTFILNGANSTSINDPSTGCAADGYDDKTGLAPVSLAQGVAYSATVSSEYDEDYCAIWIDFDNSESFEPGELVAAHSSFISPTGSNVAINIPLNAALGLHRMRVMVAYPYIDWLDPTPAHEFDPCNESPEWAYGEVHDYMVNILPAPSCAPPSNIIVSNITSSSAQVEWTGTGSFVLEYGPQGFTPGTNAGAGAQGTVITSATSPQTLGDLAVQTTYDIYVRKDCGAEGYSNNSIPAQFTTLPNPATNDQCDNALPTSVNADYACGTTTPGTTLGATPNPDLIAACGFSDVENDVWFTFTATATTHRLSIPSASAMDPTISYYVVSTAAYSGSCGELTLLDCDEYMYEHSVWGNYSSFMDLSDLTVDNTYYVRVWASSSDVAPDVVFSLCIGTPPPPPVNDECANAIPIPSSGNLSAHNYSATESMDPITCEDYTSSQALDVWYSFTPEETGDITLDIDEWDIDATVEVFSGDCENPQSIACADMQFPLTFPVTADETYFFRVYGWNGTSGEFDISFTGVPLPVSASDLKGKIVNKVPQLSWVTYSEHNNQGFEVQRANDGKSFTTVGYVSSKSDNGNSNSITSYEFQDRTYIAGEAYYRYVQKDIDGKTAVSNIVRLEQGKENGFTISAYPNPATGKVSIATKGVRAANGLITLTDALGKTVHTWPVSADLLHVDLSELPAGIYLLKYTDDLNNQVIKLSKQ